MHKFVKYFIWTTLIFLLLSGAMFVYSVYREDLAMPKDGLGDVQQFTYWDDLVIVAKNSFIVLFVLLVVEIITKIYLDSRKL